MNDEYSNFRPQDSETKPNTGNGVFPAAPYQTFVRKAEQWTSRDTLFGVLTLICSVFFADWALFGKFALGFTVSFLLFFLITIFYLKRRTGNHGVLGIFCGAAACAASFIFSLYDDSFTNFLAFVGIVMCYGIFAGEEYGVGLRRGYRMIPDALCEIFAVPLERIAEPFRSLSALKNDGKQHHAGQIILGFVLAVPVLIVVLPLLIKSDAAFEGLVGSVFSDFGKTVGKLIIGLLLTPLLFSGLFAREKGIRKDRVFQKEESRGILTPAAVLSLLGTVSFCYLVYLFSQLAYFFSAFSGFLPKGYKFTLAGYARRGFFELCAVCGINLLLIFVMMLLVKRDHAPKSVFAVRLVCCGICVFSILLSATALSKMMLYIQNFGLTRLRLLTGLFTLLIALVLIVVILRLFLPEIPYMQTVLILTTVLCLTVGFADVDRTVARYNSAHYANGSLSELDVKHLGTLSDSAVPYLVPLLDSDDGEIREQAANALYDRACEFFDVNGKWTRLPDNGFSAWNRSREEAAKLLHRNRGKIEEYRQKMPEFPDEYYGID